MDLESVMTLVQFRNFLKSDGQAILHADKMDALLEAILLPGSIAVCMCPSHVHGDDLISAGNARADMAAKVAPCSPVNYSLVSTVVPETEDVFTSLSAILLSRREEPVVTSWL